MPAPGLDRVGVREVAFTDVCGGREGCRFDPSAYTCRRLAAELADEWVEYVAASGISISGVRDYRRAMGSFCKFVDATLADAERVSLASEELCLAATEWARLLPADFSNGSGRPARYAWCLQTLVARRGQQPGRVVAANLLGWSAGKIGLSKGANNEIDEFTRAEKQALLRAAVKDLAQIEARIASGWELARAGRNPRLAGFTDPANLLWALAHKQMTCQEIRDALPTPQEWPPQLRAMLTKPVPDGLWTRDARAALMRNLVRALFLHNLDLQCFRILLVAATGHASEEVSALTEADVEFGPDRVALTLAKKRAGSVRHREFASPSAEGSSPGRLRASHLDAADLLRRLHALVAPAAEYAGLASPFPLFLRAAANREGLSIRPFYPGQAGSNFHAWLDLSGVQVAGPVDIRRLRKSTKVEKAIAFGGRVSEIADDHSEEVFRGHYAHGTTLRMIAGQIITTAQGRWFEQALSGPTMLTGAAADEMEQDGAGQVLGLTGDQVAQLRGGQLDMGVTSCRDPFDSPFAAKPGTACPVAPLRCLECRHALVLPSNLPQLLLFRDHLDGLRRRLAPVHFSALWGQSDVNLAAALAEHSDAEIAQARKKIDQDGVTLQLPMSAHVEFDA